MKALSPPARRTLIDGDMNMKVSGQVCNITINENDADIRKMWRNEEAVTMNIFIVENSMDIRASLQSVFSDMSKIKVVGQAVNETGAIESIGALQPDVVILDLGLQSGSEVGVLESVKKCHARIKVIVFTHYTDELLYRRALH